jgi:cytoskeletal protein CcmA (bactofilin family)
MVGDEHITKLRGPLRELKTCGRIVVSKRGRLIAETIEAHGGIDCQGIIDAKQVLSGTTVILGPKCHFHGDLTAPGVVMQKGATVKPSMFAVPEDPLGLTSMPEAGESAEPK